MSEFSKITGNKTESAYKNQLYFYMLATNI